ncbi:MAG: hypothetical protein DMD89_29195 [Candidatus Rokuibacteriota bacterium]|nr:MAG: hypothetical protein DMD89_29195 [Candidatus Rokubacteria bacterium]
MPIVFPSAIDPVGAGVVASLARPGGNVTGLSTLSPALAGKRLELLKQAFPALQGGLAGATRRVPWSERRIDALRSGRPSERAQPRHAQCGEPRPSPRESALVPSSRWSPACPSTSRRGPSASTAGRRVMAHARARRRAGPGAVPLPTPASA